MLEHRGPWPHKPRAWIRPNARTQPAKRILGGFLPPFFSCDSRRGDAAVHTQIDAALGTWGSETDEDFSGRYSRSWPADTDEETIWADVRGWLESLGQ